MRIYIATPMYGGMCTGVYTANLMSLIKVLESRGHSVTYDFIMNESLITRARNTLAKNFLASDCDALLFIDSDQGFVAEDVARLVESGKDFIGAISPLKAINWTLLEKAIKANKEVPSHYSGIFNIEIESDLLITDLFSPVEVNFIGTGLLFASRKVFSSIEELCKTYNEPKNNFLKNGDGVVTEYFSTGVSEDGTLYSEDYYFCSKWRESGGKVYAAPWVHLTHVGSFVFSGSFLKTAMFLSEPDNIIQ